ncbi:HAD-IIB family hydrolase [Candidatus Magnetaquicoccus inordinatus]|uniref:HAD-IIB family hydrolase n=1 Tax=Candidatus Magnetaquicoccus inordinatus TaxID=2496818 RepID=UPI00102AC1D7|nr:HAD-IIB family hydrolase [Candidatus Magnetaquicoccus inordinatus]
MSKVYISDLDGTLIANDSLSDFSRHNLIRMINDGLLFTVATGRGLSSIKKIFLGIDFRLPVICYNGAFISNLLTGNHVVTNSICKTSPKIIYNIIVDCKLSPIFLINDGSRDLIVYDNSRHVGVKWCTEDSEYFRDQEFMRTDLRKCLSFSVVRIILIDSYDRLSYLNERLLNEINDVIDVYFYKNFYLEGYYWLTITSREASKDKAIEVILNWLGFDRMSLTVFGDHLNDLGMMKYANISVAPRDSVTEIRNIASIIIPSADEDGVVKYIMHEFYKY